MKIVKSNEDGKVSVTVTLQELLVLQSALLVAQGFFGLTDEDNYMMDRMDTIIDNYYEKEGG